MTERDRTKPATAGGDDATNGPPTSALNVGYELRAETPSVAAFI